MMKHATDSRGRIYVLLRMSDTLLRYDSWIDNNPKAFGRTGSGVGELMQPRDVWIDPEDRIHIEDAGNNRVVRIDDISGAGWAVVSPLIEPN